MIVEDEALIAMDLETAFGAAGWSVLGPFSSCDEALHTLAGSTPDLAVVDALLKDGPCRELITELRRRGIPCVVFSGETDLVQLGPEFADVAHVLKPESSARVLEVAGP